MNKLLMAGAAILAAAYLLTAAPANAMPITCKHCYPKWSQGPDMIDAEDNLSMHRSFGPVVADDFVSNGVPIVGFHWWGSYFLDTGQGPERNVLFEISFHENCPAGSADPQCVDPNTGAPYPYSTPKDRDGSSYFSDIFVVEEDFFGTTANGVDIYEYWAVVDPNNGPSFLNGTWEEVAGETYWVDFAWAAGQFGTAISDDAWGWAKADNGGVCILDCAVQTAPGGQANPHIGPWASLAPEDKAFEVWGQDVPEPGSLALFGLGLAALGLRRRVSRHLEQA